MLEIVNEKGLIMDLPENFSITVEKFNPLFNDAEKFFQDISYPGTAPLSPANKIFFQNAHLVETANIYYEQTVFVNLGGISLFHAQCTYRMNENNFEFTLKPNFAAVAKALQSARLTELNTNDGNFDDGNNNAEFEALMLDTCKHPDKYAYAFLPVYNEDFWTAPGYSVLPGSGQHSLVNYFDFNNQVFRASPQPSGLDYADCPFFKLNHVVGKVVESLGFKAEGNFFNDPEDSKVYVYTRKAVTPFVQPRTVLASSSYMPNILCKKLLTQGRERMHLAFDFDLASRVCEVESFQSIVAAPVAFDFTPYIERITEMTVPTQKGYQVTLKPDEQDELYSYEDGNQTLYKPDFRLMVGNAENPVEIETGTLKTKQYENSGQSFKTVMTKQPLDNVNFRSFANFEMTDPEDPTTFNNWALRLIKYDGFTEYGSGKFWPVTSPFDLDQRDINWYQFLNDCKNVVLRINVPPVVLAQIKLTRKGCFTSKEGNYTECVVEKLDYTVSGKSTDLMSVDVYIKTLNYQADTKALVEPVPEPVIAGDAPQRIALSFKAYFDPAVHGFDALNIQLVNVSGTGYTYYVDQLTQPTDRNGSGGKGKYMQQNNYIPNAYASYLAEIRIHQGRPRFVDYQGKRVNFMPGDGYYFAQMYFDHNYQITSCFISF
jgi:hypothetical protein